MDTTEYTNLSSNEYKKQTQNNWTSAPCGSNSSTKGYLTKEYFEDVENYRYSTHPWILDNIKKFNIKNKKVLEIGYGMGTDHLSMAKQGGIMYGIDITPKNVSVTKERFKIYGYNSELTIGDAEKLPYGDNSFDFVYSFGVIHHSPDTAKIISEIYRVLKPGGKCWITVYHKNSVFFWWTVLFYSWILRGNFLKESIKNSISRIEYPNDNPNLVIRLYNEKEFADMFNNFKEVKSSIDHLIKDNIAILGYITPNFLLKKLSKKYGWYVIVEATK